MRLCQCVRNVLQCWFFCSCSCRDKKATARYRLQLSSDHNPPCSRSINFIKLVLEFHHRCNFQRWSTICHLFPGWCSYVLDCHRNRMLHLHSNITSTHSQLGYDCERLWAYQSKKSTLQLEPRDETNGTRRRTRSILRRPDWLDIREDEGLCRRWRL